MDVTGNPAISTQTFLTILKIWNALNALYVWEFIITLDYEWKVIRGHLPYRWTIWVYSLTRITALVGVILSFVIVDFTVPLHCQLWVSFTIVLFYFSAAAASLLIVLRIIAIWNRNKVVIALSVIVWTVSVACRIKSAVQLHVVMVFIPARPFACNPVDTKSSILSFIPTIISNLVLLLIMLFGLLLLRRREGGKYGLSGVLWKQGVIWLALATTTEIPPLVLMALNLNDHLSVLYETPCLITMIIAATRMHRYLVDFAYKPPDSNLEHQNPPMSKIMFARTKTDTTPTSLSRIEANVHTTLEQDPIPQKSDNYSFDMSSKEKGSRDDDSSTIISASENMSQTVGDLSKLDPSQALTPPLLIASGSPPHWQTQSV